MRKHVSMIVLAAAPALLLAGCAKDKDQQARLPMGDPEQFAYPYEFEGFDEPGSPTADTHFAAGQLAEAQAANDKQAGRDEHARVNLMAALRQYERALQLDEFHSQSLHRCGVIYASLGQHDKAVDAWKRYTASVGGTPAAYTNLGYCYELAGKPDEAEQAYKQALKKDPLNKAARVNLGMLYAKTNRIALGQTQLTVVLEPAAVHWHLAHALESVGKTKEAERHFHTAEVLDGRYTRGNTEAPVTDATARIE